MRFTAGPEGAKTIREAELDRHAQALSRLGASVRDAGDAPLACTLILRSPASAPARALVAVKDHLDGVPLQIRAILAKLEPEQDFRTLCATIAAVAPNGASSMLWARNRRLWDAHEQAAYGLSLCWSGDPIRRDARNPLALFETTPEAATRAARAFAALWAASVPIPAHLLDPGAKVQSLYRNRSYPSSFFVDENGIIQVHHIGVMTEGQLDENLLEIGLRS